MFLRKVVIILSKVRSKIRSRVYCEENVIVDFFLAGHGTGMEINIYHPNEIINDCFDEDSSLIGFVIAHQDKITYEQFLDDIIHYQYYSIGLECIKRVLRYPEAIRG